MSAERLRYRLRSPKQPLLFEAPPALRLLLCDLLFLPFSLSSADLLISTLPLNRFV